MLSITPEAQRLADVCADKLAVSRRIGEADVKALKLSYAVDPSVDVVVFSAPQLSIYELRELAAMCAGKTFKRPSLPVTSPQVKPDCDRFGYTRSIEEAGELSWPVCVSTSLKHAR